MKTVNSPHCQTSHPERYALAWEALPREQRQRLLRQAGVPAKWIAPCAEARWAFLPADVCNELEKTLPPDTVGSADRNLKERDAEARRETA